jgi:predicted site-specific integrase-resolvase
MAVSIHKAAQTLGVAISTLRRWEREEKIVASRTAGGHRRYDLAQLRGIAATRPIQPAKRMTLGYARVSSHDQKNDLVRQAQLLADYCTVNGWQHEVVQDLGSGLNYDKRGLKKVIKRICSGEIGRLVLTHKDRLLRFGAEIVFSLCEHFGTEVVIINRADETSYEEDLTRDVLEIITVFSARLYGARSHKNKKIVQVLQEAANAL